MKDPVLEDAHAEFVPMATPLNAPVAGSSTSPAGVTSTSKSTRGAVGPVRTPVSTRCCGSSSRGYFLPATHGTRSVNLGGAIAADVHGKTHHGRGSFSSHVVSLVLRTADGQRRTIGPDTYAALYWATVIGWVSLG